MKIIRNLDNLSQDLKNSVLTIGNFDGVHLGHQEVLKNISNFAKKSNLKSALLTFEPHPIKIINPKRNFKQRISTLSQKLHILKEEKLVDVVFLLNFNQELANLSAQDFVKNILLKKMQINQLLVGYDFIFGKNRLGDVDLLHSFVSCRQLLLFGVVG
jgi:riboflavin kinase/FMN adenylyltransferase